MGAKTKKPAKRALAPEQRAPATETEAEARPRKKQKHDPSAPVDVVREAEQRALADPAAVSELLDLCFAVEGEHAGEVPHIVAALRAAVRCLAAHRPRKDWKQLAEGNVPRCYSVVRGLVASSRALAEGQVAAARALLELIAASADLEGDGWPQREARLLQDFLTDAVLATRWSKELVVVLREAMQRPDLRYYALGHCQFLLQNVQQETCSKAFLAAMKASKVTPATLAQRAYELLSFCPPPDVRDAPLLEVDVESKAWVKRLRKAYASAWLRLLQLELPRSVYVAAVPHVAAKVLAHLSEPLVLAGFFLKAFTDGDDLEVHIVALAGLFKLLTEHRLADPEYLGEKAASSYYTHLYGLLQPDVFAMPRRAQFLRLFGQSLRSPALPSAYVGAFCKRMARVAVHCPTPGGALWLLAMLHQTMRRHAHATKHLIQSRAVKDPWDMAMPLDRAAAVAGETALWELGLLRAHPLPAIVFLAQVFNTDFLNPKKPDLEGDAFVDLPFDSLFAAELKMKVGADKKERVPPAAAVLGTETAADKAIIRRADALFQAACA